MITTALRRAYSQHVLRANLLGFAPLTLWQFHATTYALGRVW
ncbi:MAG: hypothetical protein AB7P94_16795 [Steroidobacteraceae bacterium]